MEKNQDKKNTDINRSQHSNKFKKTRSLKYQKAKSDLPNLEKYSVKEIANTLNKISYTKFKGTVEAHINTNTTNIRGLVSMPFLTGKSLKVLAFGREAKNSGCDIVGDENIIDQINQGKIDFDVIVTTPEWMPKLAKVARILGPRGLMPNPKSGTVGENLQKMVSDIKGGKIEYRTEPKGNIIHIVIGKVGQSDEELSANIKSVYNTIGRSKIKSISISPTMGPSIKIDLTSLGK